MNNRGKNVEKMNRVSRTYEEISKGLTFMSSQSQKERRNNVEKIFEK